MFLGFNLLKLWLLEEILELDLNGYIFLNFVI